MEKVSEKKLDAKTIISILATSLFIAFVVVVLHFKGVDKKSDVVVAQATVTQWEPEENFRTIDTVKELDKAVNVIGRVSIKRERDGAIFSIPVIPMCQIPVGAKVEVLRVSYPHNPYKVIMEFYMIK